MEIISSLILIKMVEMMLYYHCIMGQYTTIEITKQDDLRRDTISHLDDSQPLLFHYMVHQWAM